MSIKIINKGSNLQEIKDFYSLYKNSYKNLCVYNGEELNYLSDYFTITNSIDEFYSDIHFFLNNLDLEIYYTSKNNVITCISIIDSINPCYLIIKYLCGNITTKNNKINGKSQGHYMLDFIFNKFKYNIILIEPATKELIRYYVNYRKPNFPYNNIVETQRYLVYGNLTMLKENCFEKIFESIRYINLLVKSLNYGSLIDLYKDTTDINSLKMKLRSRLISLRKNTIPYIIENYDKLNSYIKYINYYDIDDIIIEARNFNSDILLGGKRKQCTNRKKCKIYRHKTYKSKST